MQKQWAGRRRRPPGHTHKGETMLGTHTSKHSIIGAGHLAAAAYGRQRSWIPASVPRPRIPAACYWPLRLRPARARVAETVVRP